MKTSHQLARELLAGPDIPVVIYENAEEAPIPHEVTALHLKGYTADGDDQEVVELYGKEPVAGDPELCDKLEARPAEVTDQDVGAVEQAVGMGCGAWDMVEPKDIIRAARALG